MLKGKLELVGVFAVVVSLLFVAYEIRQNTNTAAGQAVFELNEAGRQSLFLQSTDPGLMALIILAEDDLDALTDVQRRKYRRRVFAFLNLYESAWNHHQRAIYRAAACADKFVRLGKVCLRIPTAPLSLRKAP